MHLAVAVRQVDRDRSVSFCFLADGADPVILCRDDELGLATTTKSVLDGLSYAVAVGFEDCFHGSSPCLEAYDLCTA